ncbi:MAG: hypothetical protein M3134_05465 [Actinomycetota bacterium]|nr:hypothetical protein [Actinomycetota bacterium]
MIGAFGFGHVGSGFLSAAAQGNPSPTSTRTTAGGDTSPQPGPTPTAGTPQIEFVNPSKYSQPETLSIKPDENGTYHLVAWVNEAPADAVVEFEIAGPGSGQNFRPIGRATRVDEVTFEYFWDLTYPQEAGGGQVNNGAYTLRATLYSSAPPSPSPSASPSGSPSGTPSATPSGTPSATPSGTPTSPEPSPTGVRVLDTDDEAVQVDRTAETAEITFPRNAGQLGWYDPDTPGGGRRAGFTIDVVTSEGADDVRVYYSTSPAGSEPSWTTCEQQITVSKTQRTHRIGCTAEAGSGGTNPLTDVNAVAAVALDATTTGPTPGSPSCQVTQPVPLNCSTPTVPGSTTVSTESGDAHTISATYEQDATSVGVTSPAGPAARNTCQELTATVKDQAGREIWRANVDVHATGPSDDLQFAVTENTHPFKAPDGGSHEPEFAFDCGQGRNTSSRDQGVHPAPFPEDDTHHIESTTGATSGSERGEASTQQGTDVDGRFTFALRSPVNGTTNVTVWADEDDDDLNDARNAEGNLDPTVDPQANTTITWTTPSPSSISPTGTRPTGTGTTPTATGTTPTATGTSPTGTGTSPSGTGPGQTLNCDPETDQNPVRSAHSILCRVSRPASSPSPTGGLAGVRIHAEATLTNDPDGSDSPTTPDFTCVTGEDGTCSFTHGPGGNGNTNDVGTTLYRAWIDTGNDAAPEADTAEGRDEFQQPGSVEPDGTDVVEKSWQRAPLDCDPEQDTNPLGSAHTVTCRAATAGGEVRSGTNIDVEATGANDPDSGDSPEVPDFTCTTDQNGQCSFTHGPGGTGTTNLEGVTRYRAWIDADTSNAVVEADRSEGQNEVQEPGAIRESDETDVVDKTWTRTPTAVQVTPESDTASVGACNPFTITVTGDDNQPVRGVLVDVEQRHERAGNQTNGDEPRVRFCSPAEGPNPSSVDQTRGDLGPPDESPDNPGTLGGHTISPTDQQGRVTIGIAVEPANGSDGTGNVVLTAFFETDDDDDPEAGEPQDSSTKTWVAPQARTITCEPETATNPVDTQHTVRCTVRDRFGAPVEGEGVMFTESGSGDFTSRGTRTNASGHVFAVTTSSEAGAQSITGTLDDDLQGNEPTEVDDCDEPAGTPAGAPAGACSDTVSKTWTAGTTSPAQFSREVSIEAQKSTVLYNRNVTLSGAVEADAAAPAACAQFVEVNILRDVIGGAGEFEQFATVQTDAEGTFSHNFRADVGATYVAEVEELAQCDSATSDPEPVLVKVKVSLRVSDSKVPPGKRVRFTVRTAPCPATARDRVLLFRAIDGEFGKVGSKRTNARCVRSFRRGVSEDSIFQARWPKQAEELLAGKSRSKVVRVQNRRR